MAKAKTAPAASVFVDACGDCRFWHSPGAVEDAGICKRYPPVPLAGAGHLQPVTKADAWCGEHQVKTPDV